MGVEAVIRKAQEVTTTVGKAALHAISPNDFEYYALSLELVDAEFNTIQMFNFPVMPNAIQIARASPLNIKKTGYGYFTQYSDTFQAYNISIQGTFGRKFRILINKNRDSKDLKGFDLNVKTGYGSTKLLEDICLQSQQMEEKTTESGKESSHKFLFFYNLTFNQQFVVEVVDLQFQQSLENNAMWNFTLQLKAIGDVTKIQGFDSKKTLKNLLLTSALNKSVNNVINNITAGGVADLNKKSQRFLQSKLKNGFTI